MTVTNSNSLGTLGGLQDSLSPTIPSGYEVVECSVTFSDYRVIGGVTTSYTQVRFFNSGTTTLASGSITATVKLTYRKVN